MEFNGFRESEVRYCMNHDHGHVADDKAVMIRLEVFSARGRGRWDQATFESSLLQTQQVLDTNN